jgi:hypothetical protein
MMNPGAARSGVRTAPGFTVLIGSPRADVTSREGDLM